MINLVIRSTALAAKLEMVARKRRQSVAAYAENLLEIAVAAELQKLPNEVRNAIETLAAPELECLLNGTSASGTVVSAAYTASRLRFVRDVIDPLPPNGTITITVPGSGVYQMAKADFERDFANVAESRAYTQAGYYHYPSVPKKATRYRIDNA